MWIGLPSLVFGYVGCLKVVVVYGVCGLDDVTFVGDVHGLAFFLHACMHVCMCARLTQNASSSDEFPHTEFHHITVDIFSTGSGGVTTTGYVDGMDGADVYSVLKSRL